MVLSRTRRRSIFISKPREDSTFQRWFLATESCVAERISQSDLQSESWSQDRIVGTKVIHTTALCGLCYSDERANSWLVLDLLPAHIITMHAVARPRTLSYAGVVCRRPLPCLYTVRATYTYMFCKVWRLSTCSKCAAAIFKPHSARTAVLYSQLSAAVVRHKPNDGVVCAIRMIRTWFKYDTALSAVA